MRNIIRKNNHSFVILVLNRNGEKYPNVWHEDVPTLLSYCGTNKGQIGVVKEQNLNSMLNKHVNEELCPIYVMLNDGERYISLGRFSRLSKYDDFVTINGKKIYRFGLISRNIEELLIYAKNIDYSLNTPVI